MSTATNDISTTAEISRVLLIDLENCPGQITQLLKNLAVFTSGDLLRPQRGQSAYRLDTALD